MWFLFLAEDEGFDFIKVSPPSSYETKWPYAHTHPGAFVRPWILPRAKNCLPALNFCTSLRTGAALSNPSPAKGKPTPFGVGFFLAEDEGFDLIMVSPPSSRRRATVRRTVAFKYVRIPIRCKKHPTTNAVGCFLAEDEGFEPPQTESESGVLPLHKSSIARDNMDIIQPFPKMSSTFFKFCNFYFGERFSPPRF